MFVYVAVGWATALLVIAVVIVIDTYLLEWFAQLSSTLWSREPAIESDAGRDTWGFYIVTQATMLACGWFAGVASRGRYAALLHSSVLVVICYLVFVGAGMA